MLTLFLFLIASFNVFGKVELRVDNPSCDIDEEIELILNVSNETKPTFHDIKGLDNFEVLSKREGSRIASLNGKESKNIFYVYNLLPKNKGVFTLSSIVKVGDRELETSIISIEVVENIENRSSFLEFEAERDTIYEGQKIAISYSLFTNEDNIRSVRFVEPFSLEDFWISNEEVEGSRDTKKVKVNGVDYTKKRISTSILMPLTSGDHVVPARLIKLGRPVFDGFFQSLDIFFLKSKESKLTVLPLPSKGKPNNFQGIIGRPKVEINVSNSRITVGEACTIKVKVHGNVNLTKLKSIYTNLDSFQLFEKETLFKEYILQDRYFSEKEFEIGIIATKEGEQKIPGVEIPFFDFESGAYDLLKGEPVIIEVLEGVGKKTQSFNNSKSDKNPKNEKKDIVVEKVNNFDYAGIIKIILAIFIPLSILLLLIYILRYFTNNNNILQRIEKARSDDDYYSIVRQMLLQAYGVDLKKRSYEELKALLPQKVADQSIKIVTYLGQKKFFSEEDNMDLKAETRELRRIIQTL